MFWVLKKNRLIETVLLSTHNMFWLGNKKTIFFGMHSYLKACESIKYLQKYAFDDKNRIIRNKIFIFLHKNSRKLFY